MAADLALRHTTTTYDSKAKYGGPEASDARRLRELERVSAKLTRLPAGTMLDNVSPKDLFCKRVVTPATRRQAVTHLLHVMG